MDCFSRNTIKNYKLNLEKFQRDIIEILTFELFGKKINIENTMLMCKPLKNAILIDFDLNLCENYFSLLNSKIPHFNDYVNLLKSLMDDLSLNFE